MAGGDDENDASVQGQDHAEDAARYFQNLQKMYVPSYHEEKKQEERLHLHVFSHSME